MSRTRKVIILAIVVVFVLLAGLWVSGLFSPGPIRAYDRIQLGMTLEEASDVIGVPPGHYDGRRYPRGTTEGPFRKIVRQSGLPEDRVQDGVKYEDWIWLEYAISVAFDQNGKVVGYYLFELNDYSNVSLFDRLLKLIGR